MRTHPSTRKDYFQIWLNDFGDDSLKVLVYVFFEAPDWESELRERNRLAIDIMKLSSHLGVKLAIPSQAVQFEVSENHRTPQPQREPQSPTTTTPPNTNSTEKTTAPEQGGRNAAAAITGDPPKPVKDRESTTEPKD